MRGLIFRGIGFLLVLVTVWVAYFIGGQGKLHPESFAFLTGNIWKTLLFLLLVVALAVTVLWPLPWGDSENGKRVMRIVSILIGGAVVLVGVWVVDGLSWWALPALLGIIVWFLFLAWLILPARVDAPVAP